MKNKASASEYPKSVCGAGADTNVMTKPDGGTMGAVCVVVRDICGDNLLKQPGTEGQTNTHFGMERNPCENQQTSSAQAYLNSNFYLYNS
jgi:hypothetical protein